MRNHCTCVLAVIASLFACSAARAASTLLVEDFEDGALDPRMSVQTTGSFISAPGLKAFTGLDGQYAFGYGRSPNRYNSWGNYTTDLIITFSQPTLVTSISFEEMEVFGNWGSGGAVIVDGVVREEFGRTPYNDGSADTSSRFHELEVGNSVSTIVFHVEDITDLSEIYIDNITVCGGSMVPVPSAIGLVLMGLLSLRTAGRRGTQTKA